MRKLIISAENDLPERALCCTAKKAAKATGKLLGRPFCAGLLFTDDENIRRLNGQFRGVDRETDVLSFPSGAEGYLGDIAISLPCAQRQADEIGQSLEREVAFLTAHAMLHLFGYDHHTQPEEDAMRAMQRKVMHRLGYGAEG